MTRAIVSGLTVLALVAGCRGSHGDGVVTAAPPIAPSASSVSAAAPFAVVELYTSEGCNSCPPADTALAEWVATSREHDTRVFPIAFHVDYWDALGWPDPYADPRHALRQRGYASAFGTSTIYTPQMIVNGAEQLTGSNRDAASASIARALATPVTATIALGIESGAGGSVVVRWRVEGAPDDAEIALAVVERELVSRVRAGENEGKTLKHENVVRVFATTAVGGGDGATTLVVPASVKRSRAEIIGFVQRGRQHGAMPIVAAARAALPS